MGEENGKVTALPTHEHDVLRLDQATLRKFMGFESRRRALNDEIVTATLLIDHQTDKRAKASRELFELGEDYAALQQEIRERFGITSQTYQVTPDGVVIPG